MSKLTAIKVKKKFDTVYTHKLNVFRTHFLSFSKVKSYTKCISHIENLSFRKNRSNLKDITISGKEIVKGQSDERLHSPDHSNQVKT